MTNSSAGVLGMEVVSVRGCSNYWERYYENLSVDSAEVEKWQPCGALPKFVKTYLNPSDLILDIGCGSGRNACFLAENNLTVSGLDLSSRAVDFCQKRFSRQKLFGEFRQGSLQHIPFESNYFDAIICVGTIDHVTDYLKCVGY